MAYQTSIDKKYLNHVLDYFEGDLYTHLESSFDKRSSVTSRGGRPYDYSPKELADLMIKYFRNCANNAYPITITALCLNIGISREGFRKLEKSHNAQLVDTVKKGRSIIEFYYELLIHVVPNPAFQIFVLKNMGWSDKLLPQSTQNIELSDRERIEALERIRNFSEKI